MGKEDARRLGDSEERNCRRLVVLTHRSDIKDTRLDGDLQKGVRYSAQCVWCPTVCGHLPVGLRSTLRFQIVLGFRV
jgi:hypothetical protein